MSFFFSLWLQVASISICEIRRSNYSKKKKNVGWNTNQLWILMNSTLIDSPFEPLVLWRLGITIKVHNLCKYLLYNICVNKNEYHTIVFNTAHILFSYSLSRAVDVCVQLNALNKFNEWKYQSTQSHAIFGGNMAIVQSICV